MSDNTPQQRPPQRVGLFGGTGFVGSYLVDALLAHDLQPVLLVRQGSEPGVEQREGCSIFSGDIDDADAVKRVIDGSDALVYNIGILREFPRRGITFEKLQFEAARRVMDMATTARGRKKLMLPAPALAVMTVAALLDRFEAFPITRDQVRMLLEGSSCAPDDLATLGIDPRSFSAENLQYLAATFRQQS